jgi:hypothetical protein
MRGFCAPTVLASPPVARPSPPQPANAANAATAVKPNAARATRWRRVHASRLGWQPLRPAIGIVRLLSQRSRPVRDIPVQKMFFDGRTDGHLLSQTCQPVARKERRRFASEDEEEARFL